MDANLSAVVHTAKQLALLAETLERRATEAATAHATSAVAFRQALASVTSGVENLLSEARRDVATNTRDALSKVLAEQAIVISEEISASTGRVRSAVDSVDLAAELARSALKKQLRIVYASVAGAVAFLCLGGGLVVLAETSAYRNARARSDAAMIDADVAEAYARAGMTSCGGKPCLKLDIKSRRWGPKGEYVLLELTNTRK